MTETGGVKVLASKVTIQISYSLCTLTQRIQERNKGTKKTDKKGPVKRKVCFQESTIHECQNAK